MIDGLKITTESGWTLTIPGNWVKQIEQAFLDNPEWFAEHGYVRVQPVPNLEQGVKRIFSKFWHKFVLKTNTDCLYEPAECDGCCDECITQAILSLLQPAISPQEGETVECPFLSGRSEAEGKCNLRPGIVAVITSEGSEDICNSCKVKAAIEARLAYIKTQGWVKLPSKVRVEMILREIHEASNATWEQDAEMFLRLLKGQG